MKKRITADAVRQYAAASRDTAAIHLNAEAAAKAGYERPIAHGMYIMGLAQSLYLAEHQALWIHDYSMKFLKPLFIDTMASFDFEACEDTIHVTVTTETGEVIALGSFSVKESF
ncbi:MaoC family dehydratase [Paenibacillus sp. KQZ6P-2]|uniref:MaoC family dehydratase n=1 Tax=Paenibacillus mangrovi TaxID=2931978 RepID=A0A9X2B440_9BACL|nr:MaoC family dehydratase [Paenibacillus mangrovi]MCJ8013590.1 MaoC family dehydratase [Paenibacillus mangrovi]